MEQETEEYRGSEFGKVTVNAKWDAIGASRGFAVLGDHFGYELQGEW